ncbi:DNA-binding transcriptional regulator, MerR family [Trichlorobacter thiogenes]|uniref:DNA-binding transcriptional regulator, MerR family n=1 Tax=Trichlorobacter thiogenes TaxID=115783 RepID=A0A1T4P8B7_9BACT|nr:MerR family transcriptional regulator [Trichlorobacter thiogenes]SJZ87825.1 DNA-binding transcriptional regulator, MerR family [Trichlorobacter thiogenes]
MPVQFSISDLERETGISRDTLRIWERRYGFPAPQRNQRSERNYSVEQLERLRLIKQLMDSGMRPGKLAILDLQQLSQITQQQRETQTVPRDVEELLQILATGPRYGLLARLEALLQQQGLRDFLIGVLAPMNHAVGEAWFAGRIGVLDEHHYAEQARMVLLTALRRLPQTPGNSRALLTTLPGEQHGLGLLMATCMLALEGVEVLLLGVQTPLEEIVRGAIEGECSIVGISCSEYMNRRTVATQLVRLRNLLPDTTVLWAGGGGIKGIPAMPTGIQLFSSLDQISTALQKSAAR